MTIPDRIEMVRVFPVSRRQVWTALTEPEQFSQWFGTKVQVDPRVGGEFRLVWDQHDCLPELPGRIEEFSPVHRFAFRWHAETAGADPLLPVTQTLNTLVTFTLEGVMEGTRLTLIESGFASLPPDIALDYLRQNERTWQRGLFKLERSLLNKIPVPIGNINASHLQYSFL